MSVRWPYLSMYCTQIYIILWYTNVVVDRAKSTEASRAYSKLFALYIKPSCAGITYTRSNDIWVVFDDFL